MGGDFPIEYCPWYSTYGGKSIGISSLFVVATILHVDWIL